LRTTTEPVRVSATVREAIAQSIVQYRALELKTLS